MISKKYIQILRKFRKFHRYLGLSLAILLFISALTGVLLALKKEVELIQPSTQKGNSTALSNWQSLDVLAEKASQALYQAQPDQQGNPIDRLDVRPTKGIVKVLFENWQWEVQIDGQSGEVLSVAKRYSDWIEALHDGSIISDGFKLVSMNFLGIGIVFLICTGLWLWYGPKRLGLLKKRLRKKVKSKK